MSRSLRIAYTSMPPSENKIRVKRWQGGLVYSKEAELFRQGFRETVGKENFFAIQQFLAGHTLQSMYAVTFVFYFTKWDILNKGWFVVDSAGKRKAATLHKKMDVGNRRKLIEDCLSDALGIDDSVTYTLVLSKLISDQPRIEILIEELKPSEYGVEL